MATGQARPDWRDAAAYRPLLGADRSLVAWEWLRRDPAYRAVARAGPQSPGDGPGQWGLHAFEVPDAAVPHARPVWRAHVHPWVLSADARRLDLHGDRKDRATGNGTDVFDLTRLAVGAHVVRSGPAERLLLTDGLRTIRLDILSGTVTGGPVRLHYRLAGLEGALAPLLTLRRLIDLCSGGGFAASLHRPEARARRWIALLRAHDALAAGAAQREIASTLLARSALEPGWRICSPSLRLQAQRLVRGARAMAAGGWWVLLR